MTERLLELDDDLIGSEEDESESEEVETEEVADTRNPEPRRRWNACPASDGNHEVVPNPKKRGPYGDEYVCKHCGKSKWTPSEIEELITNPLLARG